MSVYSKNILGFIKIRSNSICYCHILKKVKFLICFHLGVSNFCGHKHKHSSQDLLNHFGSSGTNETEKHFYSLLVSFDFASE